MKISFESLAFMILMLCAWQNVHSQLLNFDSRKGDYLPPYNDNWVSVSPEIEKWMKEELAGSYDTRVVEMKTDILGRIKKA